MSRLGEHRIGFIGAGAMAEALIGGLLASGARADQICAVDPDPERREFIAARHGVRALAEAAEAARASDVLFLAVKPAVVGPALQALAGEPDLARPLWISIAAGVSLRALAGNLPSQARIVRAMPNTPARVGAAATAICANPQASPEDVALALELFESVGTCWAAPSEASMDAVTGLSGSGPAYVFVFLEALGDAGVRMGLPPEAAHQLAAQTVLGAARLAIEEGVPPAVLRDQVSSPGGTTVAGLERLEAAGLRAAVDAAVEAATRRAHELGGDEP
ncbi:MAG: pyrroline-5-carboxylate reductase [Myxococcota bacterium]